MSNLATWRDPYRTMDASGCGTDAASVGWAWIGDLAEKAKACMPDPGALFITQDGGSAALFHSTKLLAVATVFRDDMNFAILVRWMDDYFDRLVDDRQRCACKREVYERVLHGGTCAMGGCPHGGDF